MSTVKGGDYVLTASVFRLRGDDGVPRRYKRGDTITLTAEQAERLLGAGAVAKPSAEEAKAAEDSPGAVLAAAPPAPAATSTQVSGYAAAAANSGLGDEDASGGVLSAEQRQHPALVTDDGTPPKSATVDVWRAWAVDSGKLTEDEADEMNKAQLQALAK